MVSPGNGVVPTSFLRLHQNDRYKYLKDLNRGAFGVVMLAEDTQMNNRPVAIKFIPRDAINVEYVQTELINHRQLVHPHIIQYQEVFLDPDNLAIVMEYANGGDMYDYVRNEGRLTEDVSRRFFQQLVVAVDYCHKMGVVNRDLKLDNALVHWTSKKRALLKVCDFGYSKNMRYQSAPHSRVGTPAYLAPEVIGCTGRESEYDGKASDIWSCGVMLYTMLCGEYPFERNDPAPPAVHHQRVDNMIKRILSLDVDYSIPQARGASPAAIDLLKRIFVKDPNRRITMSGISSHPWFLEGLPAGALDFNDKLIRDGQVHVPEGVRQELCMIVEEARRGAPAAMRQHV